MLIFGLGPRHLKPLTWMSVEAATHAITKTTPNSAKVTVLWAKQGYWPQRNQHVCCHDTSSSFHKIILCWLCWKMDQECPYLNSGVTWQCLYTSQRGGAQCSQPERTFLGSVIFAEFSGSCRHKCDLPDCSSIYIWYLLFFCVILISQSIHVNICLRASCYAQLHDTILRGPSEQTSLQAPISS